MTQFLRNRHARIPCSNHMDLQIVADPLKKDHGTEAYQCGVGTFEMMNYFFESVKSMFHLVTISERRRTWQLHTSQETSYN
jgi:hypothetical protein